MPTESTTRDEPRPRLSPPRLRLHAGLFLLAGWFAAAMAGCTAYRFGAASLYHPGIRTIHVPVVRNETFRHDLGVRLTEALVREIEIRTPYKVTGDPWADSVLQIRVISEGKLVLTETADDDPRALDAAILVEALWTDRQGQSLMSNRLQPTGIPSVQFGQDSRFVPEAGQSIGSATQAVIEELAQRIVSEMEVPW